MRKKLSIPVIPEFFDSVRNHRLYYLIIIVSGILSLAIAGCIAYLSWQTRLYGVGFLVSAACIYPCFYCLDRLLTTLCHMTYFKSKPADDGKCYVDVQNQPFDSELAPTSHNVLTKIYYKLRGTDSQTEQTTLHKPQITTPAKVQGKQPYYQSAPSP